MAEEKLGILDRYRLIDIELVGDTINYLKKHDRVNEREDKNYLEEISNELETTRQTVSKLLKCLEYWGLIEKRRNGQKKVVRLKINWKSGGLPQGSEAK